MRIKIRFFLTILFFVACMMAKGGDPMSTLYSYEQCEGSHMPYPTITQRIPTPDSLTAIMINHIGRHGARYPGSESNIRTIQNALSQAKEEGTITDLGNRLFALTKTIQNIVGNDWGALDSLGIAEQQGIAARMYMAFPHLFEGGKVQATSSYAPRCMMSMYAFTHQLDRLCNRTEFFTSTGRQNSALLRPFDLDEEYKTLRNSKELKSPYDDYFAVTCPSTPIERVLGKGYSYKSEDEKRTLSYAEYNVLSMLSAIGLKMPSVPQEYFTLEEWNAAWRCFNLNQYLQRTASTISALPAEITSPLLLNLIESIDQYVYDEGSIAPVQLRFGHAETLMPLLSQLRIKGCYYLTNYFDTVAQHWKNFYVVPMAANLQVILFKTEKSAYYVRFDVNEEPVALLPNNDAIYVPWSEARTYMLRCVPFYAQP